MSDHMIMIYPSRIATPPYHSFCICGQYRSREYTFPGQAEAAGLQHVKAKNAADDEHPMCGHCDGYQKVACTCEVGT